MKWFIYCEAEYANSPSVSNLCESRPSWVTHSHALRVWVHRHTHTLTHSYVSVNTVPFYSPCAVLPIVSLILIWPIPLGTYH